MFHCFSPKWLCVLRGVSNIKILELRCVRHDRVMNPEYGRVFVSEYSFIFPKPDAFCVVLIFLISRSVSVYEITCGFLSLLINCICNKGNICSNFS